MDSSLEPVNHKDTSVSPSANVNENNLDCVAIPEIIKLRRNVPTGFNHSEPSTNKKFSSKKNKEKEKAILRRQPPDPFRNCGLKIALGTNNAFDQMHPQKQKNTNYNNDTPNVSVGSINTTTRKKTGGSSVRSPAWKWFEEVYIDNI
ncbi:2090_t:CDS:2 [Gigaspora margarita]|uniref:2090_t:CDS:1 n=1 Tax=Gigaspora margarita TaxID=4874 RepID=A0ABN7W079_GIGMA|nr:2090_t:CDS:2 [Gigaspora margarita]